LENIISYDIIIDSSTFDLVKSVLDIQVNVVHGKPVDESRYGSVNLTN